MDPIAKKMYIGPHKFIFEHELGHAKDEILATVEELAKLENIDEVERKIAKNSKLQEIFNEEKALFKEKMPDIIKLLASALYTTFTITRIGKGCEKKKNNKNHLFF